MIQDLCNLGLIDGVRKERGISEVADRDHQSQQDENQENSLYETEAEAEDAVSKADKSIIFRSAEQLDQNPEHQLDQSNDDNQADEAEKQICNGVSQRCGQRFRCGQKGAAENIGNVPEAVGDRVAGSSIQTTVYGIAHSNIVICIFDQ